jgi:putative flippase GtrA
MNYPRIALAGFAAWLASIALGYLINDIWLFRLYQANAWAFRRPDDVAELVPIGLGAQLLACFAFAIAYAKGYEGEGSAIGEGIRYGLVIAVMVDGFAVVWNYVTEPIATRLGVLELVARVGEFGVYGAVIGLIYRPRELPLPQVDSDIVDLEAGFRHVESHSANPESSP